MARKLLMGNEAIARGAIEAGLNFAAAYPGTPSSEIIGTLAEWSGNPDSNEKPSYYVEWSVNEKVALEVAAGAAYAGAYSLVAMKQVGLNVASDPLMSLAYIGVKGALVVVVADDPGPHSSQTEQDTRTFARFAKLPVFDPASPEEALDMTKAAFELSHHYGIPVILRPTTRVCHATAGIDFSPIMANNPEGFVKDSRWVIFPRLSYFKHQALEELQLTLSKEFSGNLWNQLQPGGRFGIVTSGVSALYVREAVTSLEINPTILKIGNPWPLPTELLRGFLSGVDQALVVEELDPVLEEGLISLAGQGGVPKTIYGKIDKTFPRAGEYSPDLVKNALTKVLGISPPQPSGLESKNPGPDLPVRPPVLCAGCSHRASFYAVKRASRGLNAIYTGDIGCYTLGNAAPLSMVDTCLCMGAGITIAQGLWRIDPTRPTFAFIGDSTFFHTGIPGVINAVYNRHPIKIILLDNATTAMTGHQPHPGMGRTAVKDSAIGDGVSEVIDSEAILKACGVKFVAVANPLELKMIEVVLRQALEFPGVAAVIMRQPCAAITKPTRRFTIDPGLCSNCERCLRELGCPAFYRENTPEGQKSRIQISPACHGCGLCAQICPAGAMKELS
ncbi:MAG TPA: indolepyruvate ferredoxin oxidoreductase subunit alpha [Bacillota bacterium]|nr:indolepyruvate ferredoxin oxidoreductase subunit alpha [Bacillota bacterium]